MVLDSLAVNFSSRSIDTDGKQELEHDFVSLADSVSEPFPFGS